MLNGSSSQQKNQSTVYSFVTTTTIITLTLSTYVISVPNALFYEFTLDHETIVGFSKIPSFTVVVLNIVGFC